MLSKLTSGHKVGSRHKIGTRHLSIGGKELEKLLEILVLESQDLTSFMGGISKEHREGAA